MIVMQMGCWLASSLQFTLCDFYLSVRYQEGVDTDDIQNILKHFYSANITALFWNNLHNNISLCFFLYLVFII